MIVAAYRGTGVPMEWSERRSRDVRCWQCSPELVLACLGLSEGGGSREVEERRRAAIEMVGRGRIGAGDRDG